MVPGTDTTAVSTSWHIVVMAIGIHVGISRIIALWFLIMIWCNVVIKMLPLIFNFV